ncbi:MAG: S4 domain-containing protein [Bacteroidota bacterium]|nr:S4 domain-containing protein [Bacteroidota bacterium]
MEEHVRIDKWLWAVRIFKTRSLATEACKAGRVKSGEHTVKPSHEVHMEEVITVSMPPVIKTVKVAGISGKRVAAARVPLLMEDLTSKEEYEKLQSHRETDFESRDRGTGRPTKRERRDIEYLKRYLGLNK